ncbi:MAG: endonuclease/exonuclease/phosphatase family protein [Rhodobacteraceae bacterium]|nr:endonuclease/exonuclease/phosphatase family protein [Paracoccaceae bacterium]
MTTFTIATFNVQNLIGPGQEFYRFEQYTEQDYAHKEAWLAGQLARMNADIVGFQEIFEPEPLRQVIAAADAQADTPSAYGDAALAFAPNIADSGPGERRPGLAVLSRLGFAEDPQAIQLLDPPIDIPFHHLGGGDAGSYQIQRLSRPILKVRIPVGDHIVTVFNAHLKSGYGEFVRPHGARFSPEVDLLNYDAAGRAMGILRASLRRMAEAWVLRKLVLDELDQGRPVIVLGDFNDVPRSPTQEILTGEAPLPDYTRTRRHDAQDAADWHSPDQAAAIHESVTQVRLHSAQDLFARQTGRDVVFTTAFDGVFTSLDAILLSRHFHPDWPGRIAQMSHLSAFNDHVAGARPPGEPGRTGASDHGQLVAHMRLV